MHMIVRKNYGATHFVVGRDMVSSGGVCCLRSVVASWSQRRDWSFPRSGLDCRLLCARRAGRCRRDAVHAPPTVGSPLAGRCAVPHFISPCTRPQAGTKSTRTGEDFYGPYDAQVAASKFAEEIKMKVVTYENMVSFAVLRS